MLMIVCWLICLSAEKNSYGSKRNSFDHLCENEKAARRFLAKNIRLRKLWLDGFLFSQHWLVCFMLTVMVALGINFCYSTSIDLPLYYIWSLLYYWDDTIVQIMYLYCLDTMSRYYFCILWRCNANGERLMWLFLYKYYGYIQMIIFNVEVDDYFCTVIDMSRQFGWLFFMLKWMISLVLLQVCLGNAGAWICKTFHIFCKVIHKPNMRIDFP